MKGIQNKSRLIIYDGQPDVRVKEDIKEATRRWPLLLKCAHINSSALSGNRHPDFRAICRTFPLFGSGSLSAGSFHRRQ